MPRAARTAVVVCGTTAEPSTLTPEERMELLKVAIDAAAGRIQVVAATGTQTHADTVRMTEAADKAGADALLIVTPYFIRPPQRGLEAYYLDLCRRTDLPVMIYHIPGRAAVNMTVDTDRADRRQGAEPGRHQARGQRPGAGERADREVRPGLPHLRRARGTVLPDALPRGRRPDERGRQPDAAPGGRAVRGHGGRRPGARRARCTTSSTSSTRRCSSTPTRSR